MSDVLRVLHVLGSMNTGGQETFIMNIYRNIDRSKVQFDFLINVKEKCDYEDEIISMGGAVHRVPRRFPNYFQHLRHANDFFKTNKQYKIVHQHTNSLTAISTAICSKKAGISKVIYHCHSSKSDKGVIGRLFNFYYKPQIEKYITHYFACSEMAAKNLFGTHIGENEIKIIPNAIEIDKFVYEDKRREQKRKQLEVENKFVVGHVGRFAEAKNHAFLIEIFEQIYSQNKNAILLLVGDGELRDSIEEKVDAKGLSDNVIFAGLRTDVSEFLCAMDVFVFPSLWEGLGIALVEAQANGLRCIVSDTTPKETKITNLVEYISLQETPKLWAAKAIGCANGYERIDMQEAVRQAGYDIKEVSMQLQNFYLENQFKKLMKQQSKF